GAPQRLLRPDARREPSVAEIRTALAEVVEQAGGVGDPLPVPLHVRAERVEAVLVPPVRVVTDGPHATSMRLEAPRLLGDPDEGSLAVGEHRETVADDGEPDPAQRLEGGRVEGVVRGDPRVGTDPVSIERSESA